MTIVLNAGVFGLTVENWIRFLNARHRLQKCPRAGLLIMTGTSKGNYREHRDYDDRKHREYEYKKKKRGLLGEIFDFD